MRILRTHTEYRARQLRHVTVKRTNSTSIVSVAVKTKVNTMMRNNVFVHVVEFTTVEQSNDVNSNTTTSDARHKATANQLIK